MAERLQKIIARAGICSRRAAEELIKSGSVRVNGLTASVGDSADPVLDRIEVDGEALPSAPPPVYLMLNKPRGYVTTLADERGRPTVAELVSNCGARVFPVGRLDRDSEGLLLLTNDGDLMQSLIHPRYQIDKVYHVNVIGFEDCSEIKLKALRELAGEKISPAGVELLSRNGTYALLQITIHEGKNRQIRRMCSAVGLDVVMLQRVREHTLSLGTLRPGEWRYLTKQELDSLKDFGAHEK